MKSGAIGFGVIKGNAMVTAPLAEKTINPI